MQQQDYFMRYVEETGKVIARAMGLKEKGDTPQALEVIDQAWTGMLEVDLAVLKAIADDKLVEYVTQTLAFSDEKLEACAELLFWEGQFLQHANNPQNAEVCYRKARVILQEVIRRSAVYSQQSQKRLQELDRLINQSAE